MSILKTIYLQHLNGSSPNATLDANGNMTVTGTVVSSSPTGGMRNKIINGDMRIDQRNAGANSTPTVTGTYFLDRWQLEFSQASKLKIGQDLNSVTPPAGFTNYLGIQTAAAFTSSSSDYFLLEHKIEGLNCADFDFGKSTAKTITLSFWVYSSLTGTFSGGIANNAYNRTYVFNYTISSANTWTYVTVTIPGDITGTWLTNSGIGIFIRWDLGSGSSSTQTAGSWGTGVAWKSSGSVSLAANASATFYITGVQLEVGTIATPFERRQYGTELALCQRYYQKTYDIGTVPGTATYVNMQEINGYNGTNSQHILPFMFTMRATPSVSIWDGAGNANRYSSAASGSVGWFGDNLGTITLPTIGSRSVILYPAASSAYTFCIHYAASAEL